MSDEKGIVNIFEAALADDPSKAFDMVLGDLCNRLSSSVSPHTIDGIKIAMKIAYRLGERAGLKVAVAVNESQTKKGS